MSDSPGVVEATAVTGEVAAVASPTERLSKQLADVQFAQLLNTRQALRFSIDELKRKPDTLADFEAQLAHVEALIASSGRPDPELVNIDDQAETARIRAENSARGAAEDAARATELARKAAEQKAKAAVGAKIPTLSG